MKGVTMRRRLVAMVLPALVVGMLSLAACGLNLGHTQVPTAAEILQRASSVLDVNNPASEKSTNGAPVQDLTYTMKFAINMNMSDPSLGSQKLDETMTASGKETLNPRRSQLDMTLSLTGMGLSGGMNLTDTAIADYATKTAYVKISGLNGLGGTTSDKWYTLSFASLGGMGADTSMYMDYSKLKNAKLIGGETINGVAVWHLRANEDLSQEIPGSTAGASGASGGNSVSGTAKLDYYFRQDNYRPVKVVMVSSDTLSGLGTMAINGEMDFTAFNTGISIALPAASEVSPLQL